jgi:hypothetical protein
MYIIKNGNIRAALRKQRKSDKTNTKSSILSKEDQRSSFIFHAPVTLTGSDLPNHSVLWDTYTDPDICPNGDDNYVHANKNLSGAKLRPGGVAPLRFLEKS